MEILTASVSHQLRVCRLEHWKGPNWLHMVGSDWTTNCWWSAMFCLQLGGGCGGNNNKIRNQILKRLCDNDKQTKTIFSALFLYIILMEYVWISLLSAEKKSWFCWLEIPFSSHTNKNIELIHFSLELHHFYSLKLVTVVDWHHTWDTPFLPQFNLH